MNGNDFSAAITDLTSALEDTGYEFVFADGPYGWPEYNINLWVEDPPGGKDDPTTDPGMMNDTFAVLDGIVEDQGPFFGILGYSQGAMTVSAYLSWAPPGTFQIAAMFCGYLPETHLGIMSLIDDAMPYGDIPALVWMGALDQVITNDMSYGQAATFTDPTIIRSEDGYHVVPGTWEPTFEDVVSWFEPFGVMTDDDEDMDWEDVDVDIDINVGGSTSAALSGCSALLVFLWQVALLQ
jgi:predicted esterase